MIRYHMLERQITAGSFYQEHTCLEKFPDYDIDLSNYECNITPSNNTSPFDYIHVSCLKKNVECYVRKEVLNYFQIPVDFPVVYFTRKVPFTPEFKCGFYLNTFKKFNSKFFEKTIKTIKKFKSLYNDVFLAGDFCDDGSFIDESINIEILPKQSKESYFSIRELLLKDYNVDEEKMSQYDEMFNNYDARKFHFHIKIKYTEHDMIVKFYTTYPHNPFIDYYDHA